MEVSHNEHLGVAVKSLDEAIPYWENVLGLKCYAIEEVADQKVRTAFFMLGQTKIELLEPTSEESTIAKYIENRGVGIHHMALACENIEEQLADAAARVADVRVFWELRRDPLRDGLIIAVHRRRITQKRNALVRPLHAAFSFSHSTCFTGKPIPAQSTAFTQDIAAEYQYTFIESL